MSENSNPSFFIPKSVKAIFGLCLMALSACVTTSNDDANPLGPGASIVERSKESAPAWTIGSPNVLTTSDASDAYSLIYFKDRLLNLPLGIKQAQISALEMSERALEDLLKEQVQHLMKANASAARTQTAEFDRHVLATVKNFHRENARVQDMYFERLSHNPPLDDGNIRETYRVFVLVKINKKGVSDLLGQLGRRLVDSSNSSLQNLGLLLRRESKQITSH